MTQPIENFHFLPESEILDCKRSMLHCYRDSYWVVHPEKGLAFYGKGYRHPQCNTNKSITERFMPEWGVIRFFPQVLVPLNINDYRE